MKVAIILSAVIALVSFDSYLQIDTWLTVKHEAAQRLSDQKKKTDVAEYRLAGCLRGDTAFIFENGWVTRPIRNDIGDTLTKKEVSSLPRRGT